MQLTRLSMFLMLTGALVSAQTTIDTTPSWNGTNAVTTFGAVGSATPTYGQTITAPSDFTVLQSFSFYMQLPTTVVFRGEVYAWNGTTASGPNLYKSGPTSTASSSGFQLITFNTGGIQLTAGAQYVLFATTVEDVGGTNVGGGTWGQVNGNFYSGGQFVYNFGSTPASLTTASSWVLNFFGLGDLAFKATFSGPIGDYSLPTADAGLQFIISGPDGNLWFTESGANKIAKMNLVGGVTEYVVPTANSTPYMLTTGPDGNIWFTERTGNKIAKVTPSGTVTEYDFPTQTLRKPTGITSGPDGNLWFTEEVGNAVGKITTSGVITEYSAGLTATAGGWMVLGPDNNLWFVQNDGNQIGRVTTSGVITEFTIPTGHSAPIGITNGPDGNLWFTEELGNRIAKITTAGVISEFPTLATGSLPLGITTGPDGNLWFVQQNTNQIGRMTTAGVVIEFPISTPNSGPQWIVTGPDDNMWFTELTANKIGTFILGEPDLTAVKTNNVSNSTTFGNGWTWKITVANVGANHASFATGQTIFRDNLPNSNIGYTAPSVTNIVGTIEHSNAINCTNSGTDITCVANGSPVRMASNASFDVTFDASASAAGTYVNPRQGGACAADPDGILPESGGGNDCLNTVVVNKANQSITPTGFPDSKPLGTAPYSLTATATSGLPVSYGSLTTSICTVSGSVVTLIAIGNCNIQISQAGNANYNPAPNVTGTITVTSGAQTITFNPIADHRLGSAPFALSATASSGLVVTFNSQTIPVCTVSGTTVTLLTIGTCTIQATQPGNSNFLAATPVTRSFIVFTEVVGRTARMVPGTSGGDSVQLGLRPVTSTGAWTAQSDSTWLHVGNGSGTGQAIVQFTYDANPDASSRVGTINFDGGGTLTVTQVGNNYVQSNMVATIVPQGADGIDGAYDVAVNSAGEVFVLDAGNGRVHKWNPTTGAVTPIVTGLSQPISLDLDSNGDLYIGDYGHSAVQKYTFSTSQLTTIASGFVFPNGIAVDENGNVYIAASGENKVKLWNKATNTVSTVLATDLNYPAFLAIDKAGNLFISDLNNSLVKELNSATGQVSTLTSSITNPHNLSTDGAGNVYIGGYFGNDIRKFNIGTSQLTTVLNTDLNLPFSAKLDAAGNIYVADSYNSRVKEIPYAFVVPDGRTESALGGTDSLPPVLPTTANLSSVFAPTSDQTWLTIGTIANGVINFSVAPNPFAASRTAHISVLGQSIAIAQNGSTPAHIVRVSGDNQSTVVNTQFPVAMVAKVTDANSNPLQGVSVTFQATIGPVTGSFPGGVDTATVSTDANGLATAPAFKANTLTGVHNVVANYTGGSGASFNLQNKPDVAASIEVYTGSGQSTAVATQFTAALAARVKDQFGNLVPNQSVTFTAPSGSGIPSGTFPGAVATATVNTDGAGTATSPYFTANTKAGGYSVTASFGIGAPASFTLTNTAGPATNIAANSGGGQTAQVAAQFTNKLIASVTDQYGNPVPNQSVTFTAPSGAGVASGIFPGSSATASVNTDASGVATSPFVTANTKAGVYSVSASYGSGTPATFSLTNVAGPAANIAPTSGGGQSVQVATQFTNKLVATVTDQYSNPVSNQSVTFTAPTTAGAPSGTFPGSLATATANTDSSGVATSPFFSANTKAGGYSVSGSYGSGTPASFSLTNAAAAAASIASVSGGGQSAQVATQFTNKLVALVTDQYSNPVPNQSVTFTAPSTAGIASGTFSPSSATASVNTDASGQATSPFITANTKAGGYAVAASYGFGTPASFALTNVAGPSANVAPTSGSGQSTIINTTFGNPLVATVTDTYGNPVSSATVTFTAPAAGASAKFQSTNSNTSTATTNSSGVATSSQVIANSIPGASYTVSAMVGAVGPANYTLSNIGLPDLTIAMTNPGGAGGHFSQGQNDATFTISVGNSGQIPTTAPVTVTNNVQTGLILVSLSGSGWTCNANSCTRTTNDALAPGNTYPAITATVSVAVNAPATVTNGATVSGGGDPNTANNTTTGTVTVNPIVDVTSQVHVTQNGFVLNRGTGLWNATMTVTNAGTSAINTPLQVVLTNLTPGITMTNSSGTRNGSPYITVQATGTLAPGAFVTATITFANPGNGFINYTPATSTGVF